MWNISVKDVLRNVEALLKNIYNEQMINDFSTQLKFTSRLTFFHHLLCIKSHFLWRKLIEHFLGTMQIFFWHFWKISEEVIPDTPVPDYQDAATQENQNVFKFAKKFETVLTNIQKIGIFWLYCTGYVVTLNSRLCVANYSTDVLLIIANFSTDVLLIIALTKYSL